MNKTSDMTETSSIFDHWFENSFPILI